MAFFLAAISISAVQHRQATALATSEAAALHRVVSQRVDQHDAHMTSLAALALATDPPPVEAIRQVATSIIRFYPRIVAIEIVDLLQHSPRALLSSTTDIHEVVTHAKGADTTISLLPMEDTSRLRLIKRVPTEGPMQAIIVLTVDLRNLVATDTAISHVDGIDLLLNGRGLLSAHEAGASLVKVFDAPLASRTQPLRLIVSARSSLIALPSWEILLVIALVIAAAAYGLDRLLSAQRSAREARARELLASHEAKLAHASRVNAMGELASGIAHEVTQPLTAILSHSQAGQKLAARPQLDRTDIAFAFDAAARNAKRAGDILARLRAWISKDQPAIGPVDMTVAVAEVSQLLAAEAARSDISIQIEPARAAAVVLADQVHIEQIVFNLVRNAIEALRQISGPRVINIRYGFDNNAVDIDILDNGPGFAPDVLGRVFDPFFSTRPDGTGLGLSICVRLAERYGGALTAHNRPEGGARLRFSMPLSRSKTVSVPLEAAK